MACHQSSQQGRVHSDIKVDGDALGAFEFAHLIYRIQAQLYCRILCCYYFALAKLIQK